MRGRTVGAPCGPRQEGRLGKAELQRGRREVLVAPTRRRREEATDEGGLDGRMRGRPPGPPRQLGRTGRLSRAGRVTGKGWRSDGGRGDGLGGRTVGHILGASNPWGRRVDFSQQTPPVQLSGECSGDWAQGGTAFGWEPVGGVAARRYTVQLPRDDRMELCAAPPCSRSAIAEPHEGTTVDPEGFMGDDGAYGTVGIRRRGGVAGRGNTREWDGARGMRADDWILFALVMVVMVSRLGQGGGGRRRADPAGGADLGAAAGNRGGAESPSSGPRGGGKGISGGGQCSGARRAQRSGGAEAAPRRWLAWEARRVAGRRRPSPRRRGPRWRDAYFGRHIAVASTSSDDNGAVGPPSNGGNGDQVVATSGSERPRSLGARRRTPIGVWRTRKAIPLILAMVLRSRPFTDGGAEDAGGRLSDEAAWTARWESWTWGTGGGGFQTADGHHRVVT